MNPNGPPVVIVVGFPLELAGMDLIDLTNVAT
jgi:hypothetical protein